MPILALATAPRRRFWQRLLHATRHHAALLRSRQGLARLDDHLLRDIGLTRQQAEAEAARTPWDAPPHWRRGES